MLRDDESGFVLGWRLHVPSLLGNYSIGHITVPFRFLLDKQAII
jgi:hypothetical protein